LIVRALHSERAGEPAAFPRGWGIAIVGLWVRAVPRLFLALAILFVWLPAQAASGDTTLHVTSADVLAVEGKGFSPPPYSQASGTLQGQ